VNEFTSASPLSSDEARLRPKSEPFLYLFPWRRMSFFHFLLDLHQSLPLPFGRYWLFSFGVGGILVLFSFPPPVTLFPPPPVCSSVSSFLGASSFSFPFWPSVFCATTSLFSFSVVFVFFLIKRNFFLFLFCSSGSLFQGPWR